MGYDKTFEQRVRDFVNDHFNEQHKGKHFLHMLFNTELELGISNQPNRWECSGYAYFDDGLSALDSYANFPNPASQLIDATSKEELIAAAIDMNNKMKDINWLNENLYPYM